MKTSSMFKEGPKYHFDRKIEDTRQKFKLRDTWQGWWDDKMEQMVRMNTDCKWQTQKIKAEFFKTQTVLSPQNRDM